MADDSGDKTHDATPHRREKAREQGQIARSQDLASAVLLVAGLSLILYMGRDVINYISWMIQEYVGGKAWLTADRDFMVTQWNLLIYGLAKVMLPILGALLVAAVLTQMAQVGILWLPEKLGFDLSRINPLEGYKRLISLTNVMRLIFGMFKILIVVAVAYWCLKDQVNKILAATGMEVPQIAAFITDTTLWTCMKIGIALLILALLDYFYQWWKQEQDLRMSTQEIRDEMKDTQGDPQVMQRRKAVQRQLALARLKTSIPQADVIVTNPTELAIAIQYDIETMAAPVIVAKGAGLVAQKIRRVALENNIPIVERKELARVLYKQVEIGHPIPSEQYTAVAEVLRYVYQLKGKTEETLRKAQLGANQAPANAKAKRGKKRQPQKAA